MIAVGDVQTQAGQKTLAGAVINHEHAGLVVPVLKSLVKDAVFTSVQDFLVQQGHKVGKVPWKNIVRCFADQGLRGYAQHGTQLPVGHQESQTTVFDKGGAGKLIDEVLHQQLRLLHLGLQPAPLRHVVHG